MSVNEKKDWLEGMVSKEDKAKIMQQSATCIMQAICLMVFAVLIAYSPKKKY